MRISSIAAVAANRVIGRDGGLPWDLPDDRAYFARTVRGRHVLMGRKTFEETGEPLPACTNVVITRNPGYRAPGCRVVGSLPEALDVARQAGEAECFVIGGGEIFHQVLPVADCLHLTRLDREYGGDTRFPPLDPATWIEVMTEHHPADGRHACAFTFVHLKRRGSVRR